MCVLAVGGHFPALHCAVYLKTCQHFHAFATVCHLFVGSKPIVANLMHADTFFILTAAAC